MPSFDESEEIRSTESERMSPNSIAEILAYGTRKPRQIEPYHPMQNFDLLSAFRTGGVAQGGRQGDGVVHGGSFFKGPDHPTRFGPAMSGEPYVEDRMKSSIQGQSVKADVMDPKTLGQILSGLGGF
jgi:hypothetical protein